MILAPCQWGAHPDSHTDKLVVILYYDGRGILATGLAVIDRDKGQRRCETDRLIKFRFREVFFVYHPDLPAKFGAHRSINDRGVAGQTNTVTFLKF